MCMCMCQVNLIYMVTLKRKFHHIAAIYSILHVDSPWTEPDHSIHMPLINTVTMNESLH